MSARVRVEHIDDGYEVVLDDDTELVLAQFGSADCDVCAGLHDADTHTREDAERYAAQVRHHLQTTRSGS